MTIHVVGGVYGERCVHPRYNDVYGSAGRAALAIATVGSPAVLHSYMNHITLEFMREKAGFLDSLRVVPTQIEGQVSFLYINDMAAPEILGVPASPHPPIEVEGDRVVRFGMLEGDAVVKAKWAVHDPQNVRQPVPFHANGSTADHLALILNSHEAATMAGTPGAPVEEMADTIARQPGAEVVVVKKGPQGALVRTSKGTTQVPAYRSSRVWKVGSGDCFVAHFANAWMHENRPPEEAADRASRATAFYCENQGFPTPDDISDPARAAVQVSDGCRRGELRQVYLAGPFFDLMQVMLLEQTRANLAAVGLRVFSPYHDIGLGSARDVVQKDLDAIRASDVVFAIADGLDAGTVFEIGYARAHEKPVVVYNERHKGESVKMMEGSGCIVCHDYATAIYSTLWEAVAI